MTSLWTMKWNFSFVMKWNLGKQKNLSDVVQFSCKPGLDYAAALHWSSEYGYNSLPFLSLQTTFWVRLSLPLFCCRIIEQFSVELTSGGLWPQSPDENNANYKARTSYFEPCLITLNASQYPPLRNAVSNRVRVGFQTSVRYYLQPAGEWVFHPPCPSMMKDLIQTAFSNLPINAILSGTYRNPQFALYFINYIESRKHSITCLLNSLSHSKIIKYLLSMDWFLESRILPSL